MQKHWKSFQRHIAFSDQVFQKNALSKELGRKVTVEELSEETGISEEKIRDAARITADHIEFLEPEG